MPKNGASSRTRAFLAFATYLFAALFFTFPLVLHLDDRVPNDLGDPLQLVWAVNWNLHALFHQPLRIHQANTYYPLPDSLAHGEPVFGPSVLAVPVLLVSRNPMVIYNLAFLTTFVLSGYFMYLLVRAVTGSGKGAFLAGLFFAFSPYRFAHMAHLNLLGNQFLPLLLLFIFRYFQYGNRTRDMVGAAGSYLMLALSTGYYLAYTIPFAATFAFFVQYRSGRPVAWKRTCIHLFAAGCAVAAILWFAYGPHLRVGLEGEVLRRPVEDRIYFSARLKDYVSASWQCRNLLWFGLRNSKGCERGLFPGFVALLGVLVFVLFRRDPRIQRRKPFVRGLLWAGGAAFVLSLGPCLVQDGERMMLLPYLLFSRLFPGAAMLRVPSRFGMYVAASIVVLAGIGYALALDRIERPRLRTACFVSLILLFAVEAAVFPFPLPEYPPAKNIPSTYRHIAGLPPEAALVELPMLEPEYRDAIYMCYSTLHWRRIVNGAGSLMPFRQDRIRTLMNGFPSTASISWLRRSRVDYVHIHLTPWVRKGHRPLDPIPTEWEGELALVERGDETLLLRVLPRPAPGGGTSQRRP